MRLSPEVLLQNLFLLQVLLPEVQCWWVVYSSAQAASYIVETCGRCASETDESYIQPDVRWLRHRAGSRVQILHRKLEHEALLYALFVHLLH